MKKGEITVEQFVKLVLAVILVLILIYFGYLLMGVFFPSADASTVKSFESVVNSIDTLQKSSKDKDLLITQLYFSDNDYMILLFLDDVYNCHGSRSTHVSVSGGTAATSTTSSGTIFTRPDSCNKKPCLCLYKDTPDTSDPEEDLVKCRVISETLQFKNFDIFDSNDCKRTSSSDDRRFYSIILFKNLTSTSTTDFYFFINDKEGVNKKKVMDWMKS